MAKYIELESLVAELQQEVEFETTMYTEEQNKFFNMGLKCAIRDVKSQPIADVVEVRHGEWLPDYETFVDEWERESKPIQTGWVCSLCGRQETVKEPYCHCGAKMDGKETTNEI